VSVEQPTAEQRDWIERVEPLWRRAHAIAAKNPRLDVSDVFHVLFGWNDPPSTRLRRALSGVRARPIAR
jgi:hypothetical protein